jgi:predicted SAM-dependent methyltransferase
VSQKQIQTELIPMPGDHLVPDANVISDVSTIIDAPANISFNPIDARNITSEYGDNSVDAIFSYWLFPHLMDINPEHARHAAAQLYRVAKLGGQLSIGPNAGEQFKFGGNTFVTVKTDPAGADEFANEVTSRVHIRGTFEDNGKNAEVIRIPL